MPQLADRYASPRFDLSGSALLDWLRATVGRDPQARLQLTLLLSIGLHAAAMVSIGIRPPKLDDANSAFIVDLVHARTATAPTHAQIRAQANFDGGGNMDEDRRAQSPTPVVKPRAHDQEKAAPARRAVPREVDPLPVMTQAHEKAPAVATVQTREPAEPRPEPTPVSGLDVMSRVHEIASMEASVARQWEEYLKRPRRQFIGRKAKELRFARYIEDWRQKIERVGELNYPGARDTFGSMVVTVEIRADGSLEKVEVNRSSGKKVLDEAAIRIVQLAAPYAPFPPDISRDTDILSITRTWDFTREGQFRAD